MANNRRNSLRKAIENAKIQVVITSMFKFYPLA